MTRPLDVRVPGLFRATDGCDRCAGRARVRVVLRSGGELLFCEHHARKPRAKLVPIALEFEHHVDVDSAATRAGTTHGAIMSGQHGDVVVGVDGSAASTAALRWAVERAAIDGGRVLAVEVLLPVRLAPGTSYALAPYGTTPPLERVESLLAETVAAVRDDVPDTLEIVELRLPGEPGVELARAARNATLLVLGHQPHGRTMEFLLGGVTAACLRHARCPVVLVRTLPS